MKKIVLLITLVFAVIMVECDKDTASPKKPETMVRLKTGSGLYQGASVYFLALSKEVNFAGLPGDIFEYDKTEADWYIDGGQVPFTTDYKVFSKPVGEYYYLLSASGVAMMSTIDIKSGKQTFLINGESGRLRMEMEQP